MNSELNIEESCFIWPILFFLISLLVKVVFSSTIYSMYDFNIYTERLLLVLQHDKGLTNIFTDLKSADCGLIWEIEPISLPPVMGAGYYKGICRLRPMLAVSEKHTAHALFEQFTQCHSLQRAEISIHLLLHFGNKSNLQCCISQGSVQF